MKLEAIIKRDRAVFEARTVEGKKVREVAAELGIRLTQVSRSNRRYRQIAALMGMELPPPRKLAKELKHG